jgi:hypothetical protein
MKKQRHCVVELDSSGRTLRDFRIPDQRSPWTQSWNNINWYLAFIQFKYPKCNLEVYTEDFYPLPVFDYCGRVRPKYAEWIETNVVDEAPGLCLEWSGLLCQVFPELSLVSGLVSIHLGGGSFEKKGHYWCRDSNGIIVDPTARQFDNISEYIPEEIPVPSGFCQVCQSAVYKNNECCSVYCYSEFEDSLLWPEHEQWPFCRLVNTTSKKSKEKS